ncbi:K02A2.6-like, partial [Cordylochernes scorpioides]
MDFVRPSELALHGNVAENWRRFKQRLMLYLEATEKATKPDKLKVAILLNFIGEEALEVFNTFHLKEDEAENFDLVINKFDDFCEPKKNVIFERFKFFSATQKDGESIDSFITELKGLSTSCEFESQKDSLIRDRIVYGIQDKALQERLLREPNLTLLKAIEMCKTDEISKQQIKIMQNNQNICQIRKYEKKHSPKQNQESEKEFKCQRCGKSHRAKNCPAWGKRCSKCKKINHFAAFCKSSAIRSLNDETEETVWSIHEAKVVHTLEWKKSIIVNGKEICFKLDSGAEVNVLPYTFTRQMKGLEIFQTNRKLTSYTGHEIKIKGIATLNCKTKNKTESLEFFIADGYYQPILGIEAIEKLSLIKKCDAVQIQQNNSAKEILNRHKNIFEGIGRLPIEHKIRLNENTTPVIAPSRKIPFSIREKVKAELERMEKLDIIEKVEEPSEWTHPIVVVQKPSGDVRICMDPRELNKYVQRERYILPTAETIFSELKGATVFSVFDASSAFWQVPLDKESTNLCTIATPFGRFRFKRLPYGLNSASEVFQRCINNILSGLQGTACYMDDILIYGSTMEEHNRNLETVLRRLEENNVKLNAKKQQIAVDKVNFLGHIISRDGIAIQASRAEAIQKLKRPENKTEVQRFLGMVTYLGKFIPNLSDKTAPLRKLISNKSEWKFGGEEIDCFKKLKDMVSNAPILTFFDPTKPITISSDASQYGIGTVLMQGGHAIEYASFSLNATQRKYAQIEKELLAIVFGCERFQYYIWGNDVIVETDHKPLLSIVKKPLEKLSPRLQRMVLRLMRFQISLKFTPGKNMFVADHLSRDPLKDEVDTSYLEGQTESVHMLLVTTDEKIKRLQKETHGDHTLIQLIEYAKNGWPKYKTKVCDEAKPYWQFQDEIHVSDGIVYKGNCIMVPSTLRKEILQVVHSSHQGIAASKEKARSAFYWPSMITQVENEVEKCRTCQEYSRKNPEESRIAHEIPEFPWEKIAVDFMEVSGTSSILVVDYHSKFVEIRKLSSKRETETIMQLKTIFRTHGIPRTLVSDNGPPFNSTGLKNFAQKYEFKHQTSSPKYPRSNGQVERTIQTIKGLIIKAVKSGRDPNLALMEFNNTPKYDLPSPTQMLMGRSVRTLSTYTRQQLKPLFDTTKNYQKLRDHQQKYAGSPKRILRPLEVGDNIMLQERHRKWVPATVTAKHETPRSYMVKTPSGSEYRRNRSHLRPRKFSVEDSAPTSQSPSIPGSQAGTAMDDNIQDHGRPTSENRRAYDPRENVAKKESGSDAEASSAGLEVSSEGLEVSSEGSEVSSECPEVSSEGPEVSSEGPEVSSEGSEVSSEGPEVSSEGSEVSSEGPERHRIVLGCRDTTLREKYLQNPDLTLSLAINQGQAAEASQKQLRNIEKDSIDAIRKNFNEKYKPTTSLKNSYTSNPVRANFNNSIRCSKCNMAHDFGKCPAYGKECYKCRQPNHFSNCCKNRAVRCIQEIEEEKDNLLIIDSIMVGQVLRKPWKELIYIQGHPVDIKLDTGADVNILPERLIKEWPNMPLLETADCKIYTYTGQQIPVVGKYQLDCKTKYACRKVTFLIVNNSAVPILGLDECEKLNLVKRVETISDISVTLTGLLDKYKDVLKGNGHLSYMYDIKLSDKAEPKISPARRLPRALLQPVKEELFKMEEDGIIEKIEEPTVWAHPMVVEGILPDQDKVRAIQNMQIPKNKQELQRILGTVTYLAKFIPDLSSNTSNMRNLLKKDIIWNWNIAADQELNFIKTLLTSPPVLRHFDPNEPLELFADASKDGLGAILMQKEKPLSYASASLTSPQKHYSQIEKELLALYFGCKRFHYFLYGRKFTAYTDHKPLVSLLNKNFDQMSPRLQRLSLYLLNYQFELKFIPGKSMIPADTLSRHFLPHEQMEDKELDLCTQKFVLNVEIKDQRLTRLQEDKLKDKECCLLKQYMLTGWPLYKKNLPSNLKPYWEFKEELHEWQNLICRGNKLLIAKTQRNDMLKILHASHQGINNTIALAKGSIYWPGMNKEIEELINNCSICQQTSRANFKEPMLPHQAPEYPWQKVGIDIFQIESSKYLLIVDYFSKYPEIYQLQDMTTDTIIRRLKRTFSNFGIPETLVSDNGPPFFSKEFQNFTRTWNIVQVTSSPYHPQNNGMVERTVQTLKKLIKRCGEESADPYLALLNLRNTPHNNLPSPAQILMSRKLRSIIPSTTSQFVPSMINNEAIQKQLVDNQVKMKNYYDRHTRPADPLSIKDRVWFRKDKRWILGQLKNQANEPRSFYVKDQEGNEYRRNSIHIREDKRSDTTHTDWEKPLELNQEQTDLQDLEESPSRPTSSGQLSSPGSPENLTTTGPPGSCTNGSSGNLITTRSGRIQNSNKGHQQSEVSKYEDKYYVIKIPRQPNNKYLNKISVPFGNGTEDCEKWMKDYERIARSNCWDAMMKLANAPFFLEGTAGQSYDNNEEGMDSWDMFKEMFSRTFNNSGVLLRRAKDNLHSRAQKSTESCESYIQDVLSLCRQVNPDMSKEEKVAHLMKGVVEDVYQVILIKEIDTVEAFVDWCRKVEACKQRRIGKPRKLEQAPFAGGKVAKEIINPPPLIAAKLSQNIVDVTIDDKTFPALVDSGASFSVISDHFRQQHKKTMFSDAGMTLRVADGKYIVSKGRCTLRLEINGLVQPFEFVVLPSCSHDIILGWDFLEASRAIIDCGSAEILLEKAELPEDSSSIFQTVAADDSFIIPAGSTKQINVISEAILGVSDVVMEPSRILFLERDLMVPASIFAAQHGKGRIWITNIGTCDRTVPKGMCIGEIQVLEEGHLAVIGDASDTNRQGILGQKNSPNIASMISPDLSMLERTRICSILGSFSGLFELNKFPSNLMSTAKHKINTEDHPPIKRRPYRVSQVERQTIQNEVDKMLKEGIVQLSESLWSSPVVLVKNKNGSWRFCVDYRHLNKITKKDVYPLPRIDDTLDCLRGASYYSSMDLRSGYWQIEVDEADREKTAFITPDGLYEFKVMPFGLCNAPATFERMMDTLLRGLKWSMCLCYLDDIIVFSPTFDEHVRRLELVLRCLSKAGLVLNPDKCLFRTKRLSIFGHLVDGEGVYPDPGKVDAMSKFPTPKSLTDVRSFIGMCSYYHRFIKNFAQKAEPLHRLLRKDTRFEWGPDQRQAYESLKLALVSEPVLAHFDEKYATELHTDASGFGIGAVLVQVQGGSEKPIGYASRMLSTAEKNYSTTERECLAAIWAIGKFRPYLFGRSFTIVTDHHSLCWLSGLKDPSGRLARWALRLQEYNVNVVYKNGRKHQDADCLSRNPIEVNNPGESEDDIPTLSALTDIVAEQRKDPVIVRISEECLKNDQNRFKIINGALYKRNFDPMGQPWLLVIPRHLRPDVLRSLHDNPTAGHLGLAKTHDRIRRKYFWPGLLRSIRKYVGHCRECQRRKHAPLRPPGLLQPIPPTSVPFQRVGIDLLGRFPISHLGNKWIIVCTDYLTRYAITRALPSADAQQVAKFVLEDVVLKHGAPREIITDRGRVFQSKLISELTGLCSSAQRFTTAYHPQMNGLTERLNKTLANMMSMYMDVEQKEWDVILPFITFAYNTAKQDTTGFTPFSLIHGREAET